MRRIIKYIRPLWEGNDNKLSLKSLGAIILLFHFIRDLDKSSGVALSILKIISDGKTLDAASIAAISANLAQIAIMLGIEAALIAALLGLKTYQNTVIGAIPCPVSQTDDEDDTPPPLPKVPAGHQV